MIKQADTIELFIYNFTGCVKQATRLQNSLKKIHNLMPFDNKKLQSLSEEQIITIDAFILQFGRLQDMLGSKIFKGLVEISLEKSGTMIDTMNKMEKFGIIDNIDEWRKIRDIRNSVMHDYDLSAAGAADNLNSIINFAPQFFTILEKVENYTKHTLKINLHK